MDGFPEGYGEKVTGESWVMRDLWRTTNMAYGARLGLASYPKRLKSSGVKRLLERALWEQGLRHSLPQGIRRHEWKAPTASESSTKATQNGHAANQCRDNDGT